MKLYFKIFLFFIFIITNESFAQIKLDNIFTYEDGISYSTVLPVNYNKNKKYILAIGLHGLFSDGSRMVNPFSYYSRYMNIILVCPDGNFTDNGRNGVKWGYDKSDKYILNLVELIKTKYKVYDDVFLFGFSQGGNQGLQTALTNPDIFRYFAGLSGGYTSLTDKQISTAGKINILFISGDTGEGEAFTKR
ncbi:MAG TPA: alpha/beta hydrolase-fold protein, partial [Leptospiraceae bacterium]|nr:alpha/beta hydrolase-fold protein [Leptospiraceae bacterium]